MTRVVLPRPHAGQRQMIAGMRRFNLARMGRRWGKSLFGVDYLLTDKGGIPGALHGRPVGWFAPTTKLLGDVWRDTKAKLRPVIVDKHEGEHRIVLHGGGVVEFWTLDIDDPARGRKYAKVVVDEAAMVRGLLDKWHASIRPTLTDYQGGALFCSTPKGRNDFWRLAQTGQSQPDWALFHAPTSDNPFIKPEEIDAARRGLPERIFAQEYLAAFIEDGGGVFRGVTQAVTEEPYPFERDPGDGRAYVMGVDWGRHNDFTVITALDAKERRVVLQDRFNRIEYAFQLARLKAIHSRFPRAPIIAELNSMGEPLVEQLRRDGLPVQAFTTTAASKAQAIEALALAFERGDIQIPPDEILIGELTAFDQERLPSGAIRYGAPPGAHDDTVMSLALAWHGLGQQGGFYAARAPGAAWQ